MRCECNKNIPFIQHCCRERSRERIEILTLIKLYPAYRLYDVNKHKFKNINRNQLKIPTQAIDTLCTNKAFVLRAMQ